MHHQDEPPDSAPRLRLYTTADYPCSYLPDQQARSLVATPHEALDARTYAHLVRQGFRRSGQFTYRPHCRACQACVPLRIPVADFVPNRSQRRAWRQHAHLQTEVLPPVFDATHYALYHRYQQARHPGGNMAEDSVEQYTDFLLQSPVDTCLLTFSDPQAQTADSALHMVSVVDLLDDGLSAVYTFYTPDRRASYGTYGVLWQIALARQLGLPYVYLGYWISDSPKMRYKQDFRPHETLRDGQWHRASQQG